jgi:hypothetical protein
VEQGLPIKVGVALTVLDIFVESPKSFVWNCDELRGQNLRPSFSASNDPSGKVNCMQQPLS